MSVPYVQTHNLLVSQKHVLLEAWHLLILKCSVWILWSEETHKISSETKLHARMPRTYATNGCFCQKWGNVHHSQFARPHLCNRKEGQDTRHHLRSEETHIACHAGGLAVRRDTHVSSLLVLTIARLQPKGRAGQHMSSVGRRATPAKRAEQPHFFGSRYIVLIRKKWLANFMWTIIRRKEVQTRWHLL